VVTLQPNAGGYFLVYQRCCRNESILNIFNPGDTGATYMIKIPGSAFNDCNSSPRFNNFPPIVLCTNDPLQFDHSATDPDGDSLVYFFCDPFEGADPIDPMPIPPGPPPYNFVNFIPPYSAINPLASNPQAAVNQVTGELTGQPTQAGQYVVAVCVNEYRNGVLLSTNKRDFQFNVVNCSGEATAGFDAPSATIELDGSVYCNGFTVNFINQSSNALFFDWDFGVPGTNEDRSQAENPVFVYPDTGRYQVTLIINPGYSCSDTAYLQVGVYAEVLAQIGGILDQCITDNEFNFEVLGDFDSDAAFFWEFTGPASQSQSNQLDPPPVVYSEAGTFPVYFSVTTLHCEAYDTIQAIVYPELEIDLEISEADACVPATISFGNAVQGSPGALYYWTFGDGGTSTAISPQHYYDEAGLYDISLTVEYVVGCIGVATEIFPEYVRIRPRPDAGIEVNPPQTDLLRPVVEITDLSSGEIASWIEPMLGEQFFEPSIFYTYPDSGDYLARVIAVNEEGCYDTAFAEVRIDPLFNVYIPNAFSPNGDGINEGFNAKGEGFKEYRMSIFDRWGDEIYTTIDPEDLWDGRANDGRSISPIGVYNYKFWIKDVFNNDHVFLGKVVLIR
jgi:gliding motility-associated-like protein